MSGQCPVGNRGFPVVVNSMAENTEITLRPNDVKLQFTTTKLSPLPPASDGSSFSFDVTGNQSFWLGGSQYNLHTMRRCRSVTHGTEKNRNNIIPYGELHFWGRPAPNSTANADTAVMIIPLYTPPSTERTKQQELFNHYVFEHRWFDLEDLFPETDVIRYTTCIEIPITGGTNMENITIAVAYWRSGIGVHNNNFASRFQADQMTLGKFGIPLLLTGNQETYSSVSEVGPGATRTLTRGRAERGVSTPYTTSISATSDQFRNNFSIIKFSMAITEQKTGIVQYKCMAIDRQKDIVNGQVMIDPKTGKRLADTLKEDSDEQDALDATPTPTLTGGDIEGQVALALGIIGGTLLLALVVWLISIYITKKNPADAAAAAANAAATAVLPTVTWIDLAIPGFIGITFILILTIVIHSFIKSSRR